MRTDLAPPPARYRNEAIFRSAERLIASVPQKKQRLNLPRWWVFGVGCSIGIALTIAGLMIWSRARPHSAVGTAFNDLVASISTLGPAARPRPNASPLATAPVTAAAPEKNAAPTTEPTAAAEPREMPRDRDYRVATMWSLSAPSPTPGTPAEREAASYLATSGVTHYVAVATLRGEMRSNNAAPVGIEFALRRLAEGDGTQLLGTVRYLNGDTRVVANSIAGAVHDHTMTLHETSAAWTLDRTPRSLGRSFVLHLPAEPTAVEITGTWSFESQRGTLALRIAPPW